MELYIVPHVCIYIHMWNKLYCKLAEGLLYNQGCRKDTHIIGLSRKKINWIGTCAPGRRLRGKEGSQRQTPATGSKQADPQTGCPSAGDQPLWPVGEPLG